MIVKDIMSSAISTADPAFLKEDVIKIMRCENIGAVPVCDHHKHLLGIITDRDIIMRGDIAKTAEDLMSKDIVVTSPRENIHDAALKMSKAGVRHLPVVENNKLIGMLSLHDLAKKKVFISEIGHIIYHACNHDR